MKWFLLPIYLMISSLAQAGGIYFPDGRFFEDGDKVVAADLDNDGDQDLLVSATFFTAKFQVVFDYWLENNGGRVPVFTRHDLWTGENSWNTALPVDLNGDGRMDFVAASRDFSWYENIDVRPTSFTRHVILNEDTIEKTGAADLNGDGRKDLVCTLHDKVSYSNPWQLAWFEVGGSNPVRLTSHTLGFYDAGAAFELTDLDHDGDTDVVVSKTNATLWLENDGATSPTFTQHPLSIVWAHEVHAADLNGDGRVDLVLEFNWLENLGGSPPAFNSHLYYTPDFPPEGDPPHRLTMTLADLNLDGYPDIFTDWAGWFENSGGSSPTFTHHAYPEPVSPYFIPRDPTVFDADGDGDLDLILTDSRGWLWGYNKMYFFRNLLKENTAVSPAVWKQFN